MKVLLVGEGHHELGGALRALCERTVGRPLEIESIKLSSPEVHVHRGKGSGFYKRAIAWIREARRRGCDALILVVDEDGVENRVAEINRAQEFDESQDLGLGIRRLPRALGVAIRTFDAWILPDEKALTGVLRCQVQRRPDPESIRDPKQVCADLLQASGLEMSHADFYSAIAVSIDLSLLEARCSRGYAPFAARLRAL